MGWQGKTPTQITMSISWRDYVSEEKIKKFEEQVKKEAIELIWKRLYEELDEETMAGNIMFTVN
jgi:hypothetical protein